MAGRRVTSSPAPRPKRPPTPRPTRDLGQAFRAARQDQQLTIRALAARAGVTVARLNYMELGSNVESEVYAAAAHALGYRSAIEVFRAHDPQTRRLLRLWRKMDAATQAAALRRLKAWLVEDD